MMNRSDRLSFLARAAGASHQCGPPFPGRAGQERRANGAATELRRAALLAVQLQRSKRRRLEAPTPVEKDTEEGEGKAHGYPLAGDEREGEMNGSTDAQQCHADSAD